jgi:hypothetical protein
MNRILSALITSLIILTSSGLITGQSKAQLYLPLNDKTGLTIEGPHRFIKIAGRTGLHVTSIKTKAGIETQALQSDRGTLSLWMSPLEDIGLSHGTNLHDQFTLLSDHETLTPVDSCDFSIYYNASGYPRVIARFTGGNYWGQMDYGIAPVVYAESLSLQKGQWYNLSLTWDKPKGLLVLYINGEQVGHNFLARNFKPGNGKLFIGNPLMVMSELKITDGSLNSEEIRKEYLSGRPASNQPSDSTIRKIVIPAQMPPLSLKLDNSWKKIYDCPFSKKSDLDGWIFQTGDKFRDKFRLEVSDNSLLWQTPDNIDTESRGYLWCPVKAEGDQWIEFEFQLVSHKGLALIIMCASGSQGEDIIEDHGLLNTGSMGDMLANYRNYHWEFVRRVEAMRTDVETQYVNKNPWGRSLFVGCIPRLEENRWIKARFIKIGNKLYGSFDGKTVFITEDNAWDNNGPVLNSGRIVLRQMYNTALRYRNFVIYQRTTY